MKKILQVLALVALMAVPWAVNAQFCTPSPSSKDGNGITNVTFGNGSETVNSNITWSSAPYYQDNRSQVGAVPAGTECEMSITFATGYTYGTIIWVDWNGDSTFSGTEVVWAGESTSNNPTTLEVSFEVPATQDTGTVMLRICAADMAFDSYTGSISAAASAPPCTTYSWGVALDYTLRVTEVASCFRVQSISASNILDDGMTINWVDSLNSTTYTLSYWPNGAIAGDTMVMSGLSGFSYTITGLEANTLYHFSILPDCDDGNVSPRTGSFKTDCENGSCNITVNATDSYGDGWNGNAINVMQGGTLVGSATIPSGGSAATVQISVCKGDTVILTFTRGSYPDEMGGTIVDGGGGLIFTIENMDNLSGGATLATVANACPDCLAPVNLTDSINDDGDVVLSWTSTASSFMVYAGDSLYSDAVSDPFYTFTGLSASSVYQLGVAAICDGDDTSAISRLMVATPCGDISALPWGTGFESDAENSVPLCWTVLRSTDGGYYSANYPFVYNSSYSSHSGTHCLFFSTTYDDDTNFIVTSPITYNPGNLHVQFWGYFGFYSGSTFEAGLMTDTSDMSSFTPLFYMSSTSPNYVSYTYSMYEFFTDETGLEDGDTAYLAFRMIGPQGTGYGDYTYIDDISMSAIPNCRMPISGSGNIDSVRHESANFSWNGTSESGYDLMLVRYDYDTNGNVTDTVVSHIFSDTTFITVDTLMPNTLYSASVASLCNDGGETDTTDYLDLGMFQTQMRCYPVYQADLTTLTTNAAIITWSHLSDMGIAGSGAIATITDLSITGATPSTQTITGATSVTYTGLTPGHTYSVTLTGLCGTEDTAEMRTIYFTPHAPECSQAFTATQVGNNYTSSVPINGNYEYSYSQAIYSDALLVGIDTLTGVAYDAYSYSNEYLGVNSYEVDMYIGYVDTSALTYFAGQYWMTNNILVDSTMTKVATGALMSATSNGWFYLPFDTPFAVAPQDSAKRLIVTLATRTLSIENYSNSWRGYYDYTYDANYNYFYKARYLSGSSPINPATTSSYSSSYVPNIRFYGNCGGNCLAPTVNISGLTSNSVSLSWLANGDETSWRVEYKADGDTAWTLAATVTTNTYTITGLTDNTDYEVRVGAICGDDVTYATLAFRTPCSITIPYTHTFTASSPCWSTNVTYYSSNGVNIYSNYYLISPELPTPVSDFMIVINDRCYSTGSSNQGYFVAIGDANGQNLTVIDTVYATEGAQYGTHTVYFNNYTGTGRNIYIAHTNGDLYIYSVTIDYAPHCLPATNLTLDSTGLTTMGLSWTSDAASFQVSYRADGDTGAWNIVTVTTPHVVLTGLTPSTNYNVEVRPICPDSTLSTAIGDMFGTTCVTYNTPYRQIYFYNMPICWSTYNTGHPYMTWAESVSYGYGYIASEASGSTTPVNDWLMSPEIVIPATAQADSIMLVYQIAGDAGSYVVLASTNGGNATTDFTDTLYSESISANSFSYRRISLAQYAGDTIRIAFRNNSNNYGLVAMYDFGVRSVLFPMYTVNGNNSVFVGDNATYTAICMEGDSNTTNLVWTSTMSAAGQAVMNGTNASTMTIIYSAAGADTITLIATNAYGADTVISHVRVIDLAPVTQFPYSTDFESGNADNYSWVLMNGANAWGIGTATNNGGNQSLYISNDNGATNTYDPSTSAVSYAYRAFDITDTGMYNIQFDWNTNGESNYDFLRVFLVPSTNFNVTADSYPDGITSSYNFTDASITGWYSIGGKLNQATSWTTLQDSVQITATGRYLLVFVWSNDGSVGNNPAGAIDNVMVTSPVSCAIPVVSNIVRDETSLTVNYLADADSVEMIIVEGVVFNEDAASIIATTGSYNFTGLNHSTTYIIGLRALCSEDDYSDWVVVIDSTLMVSCGVPTGLAVTENGYTSTTFGWTAAGEETAWELEVYNTLDTFYFESDTTSVTATGLTAGQSYNARVRALCGQNADIAGDWSAAINFTTDVCEPVEGVAVSNITSDGATVSWTAASTGTGNYRLEYGTTGFDRGQGQSVTATGATSYTITGLESEMSYDVYVANICTESLVSTWSTVVTFETTAGSGDGIVDVDAEGNLSIYPNPASAMVSITVSDMMAGAEVMIVDLNGRTVDSFTLDGQTATFDVSTLAKGAYFVRLTGEQATTVRKLIVK